MRERIEDVGRWVAKTLDGRDVLAFSGILLVALGLGVDRTEGLVAAGVGLFYLGVFHPLLLAGLLRRRGD